VLQLKQQITGAERQLEGVRRQNELIREEIGTVVSLLSRGFERKPRLLALRRAEAELMGTEGELLARIARAEEAIGETRLQAISVKRERVEQADAELSRVQAQRIETEQSVIESMDRLSRTVIVAPTDGIVLGLRFGTPGGVIRPGEPVLDIVPATDALIINARVSPEDIDDLAVGCVSACNRDPVFGVIGFQSGPRDSGSTLASMILGSRGWDADCGNDCEGSTRLFFGRQVDQGDLPRTEIVAEGRPESHPVGGDFVFV